MAKVKNTEEFIQKAKLIHGDKYDYSESEYIKASIPIKIICKKHKEAFYLIARKHLAGVGCPKCAKGLLTTEDFIEKANLVHNNFYIYSKTDYQGSHSYVTITCPNHGDFLQQAYSHLYGVGCPECAKANSFLTKEEFIKKSRAVHGDRYIYSDVNYVDNKTPVGIICREHGKFMQRPSSHMRGQGCFECKVEASKLTTEEFIKRAKEVHGDKYDYSEVVYVNSYTKVRIRCKKHNYVFEQEPAQHLWGHGCPICGGSMQMTKEEFVKKANLVHNNFYIYDKSNYINNYSNILITCPKHGDFEQLVGNHLGGSGCPDCAKSNKQSKGEKELCKFIKSIYSGEVIENDRTAIKPKELDIFLPELKLAFEYNGEHWHAVNEERIPGYHQSKEDACREANIELITIWELADWKGNNKVTKEMIASIIQSRKVYVRPEEDTED